MFLVAKEVGAQAVCRARLGQCKAGKAWLLRRWNCQAKGSGLRFPPANTCSHFLFTHSQLWGSLPDSNLNYLTPEVPVGLLNF